MNEAIKEEWISALRSGQYAQGKEVLRVKNPFPDGNDLYCCLGVLCELAVKHAVIPQPLVPPTVELPYRYGGAGYAYNLPNEVTDWSGLAAYKASDLAAMNDNGDSFRKIAAYIEENL